VALDKIYDAVQQSCTIKNKNNIELPKDSQNLDDINNFTDLLNPQTYADETTNSRIRKDTNKMSTWTKLSGFFGSPTHIVDNIYLGSALNAASKSSLEANNIKVVINMAKELTDYYPDDYEYYKCELYDDNNDSVSEHLEKVYKYIIEKQWDLLSNKGDLLSNKGDLLSNKGDLLSNQNINNNEKDFYMENKNVHQQIYTDEENNDFEFEICDNYIDTLKPTEYKYDGNILIHCYMGASRSAIIAIYYLIKTKGYTIDSAIKYIINKRPHVNPTFRFIKDLAKSIRPITISQNLN
jgi:protein-tyrosine phosphatase